MFKKIILNLAFWLDKHLGWYNCSKQEFDGVNWHGVCKYCGTKCLQDSQGNWFVIEKRSE